MFKLFKQKQKSKNSMYDEIVSWENISEAYLDLYKKFVEKSKGHKYKGVDGQTLFDAEINIENLLKKIQNDLKSDANMLPAKYSEVAKKDGGKRGIYTLSIKDRIKCQAIARKIEPILEEECSDYVYSFRKSKPSYYASRSVRRFYLRHYGKEMYVLRMDIKKYFDYINHKHLIDVLKKIGFEEKVLNLINNIIKQPYIKNGTIMSYNKGILQGMTFCPYCANVYINHVDHQIAKRVLLYRRVGDDFIIFDNDKENLLNIKKYLEEEVQKAKLKFNEEKGQFGNISEMTFDFHGLQYKDGKVQLPQKSINRIMKTWGNKLKYNPNHSEKIKIRKLKEFLWLDKQTKNQYFAQYARAYQFVTDTKQMQYLSKRFFNIITKFFTGKLTYKAKKQTKKILKKCPFTSLPKHHYLRSNGIVK